jgi:hypothetical protein
MFRAIYRVLIELHPVRFRDRNGDEMLDIFDRAGDRTTQVRFLADAFLSLGRQWLFRNDPAQRLEPVADAPVFQLIETPRTRTRTWIAGGVFSLLLMQLITWSAMHGGGRFPIASLFNLDGVIDKARAAAKPTPLPVEQTEFQPRAQRIPFPDTLAGVAFQEWLKVLNAGDRQGLQRFFEKRLEDPAAPHVRVWMDWHERFGQLVPHTLERSTEYDIALRATAGDQSEWRIELTLNSQPPHRLVKLLPDSVRSEPQL